MKLSKKQLNLVTNWLGGIFAGFGIIGDTIPVESIVAWAYSLNPQIMSICFGVFVLFYAQGKETKD